MKPDPNTRPKVQHSGQSQFLASQHNTKAKAKGWKILLAMVGIAAASIDSTPAASILANTVGTMNGNGKTIFEATGNTVTSTTFASDIASAFATDVGGVWNFDGDSFGVNPGETITLNYGASLANSLVLTLGGSQGINQGITDGEPTSGGGLLGLSGDASTRTFTPSAGLLELGIFNTDRNDSGRLPVLTVTFLDSTTASTSGANANDVYFHGFKTTIDNPIVSFSISQSNFVRYDDLGFVVASSVPEPSRTLLLVIGAAGLLVHRHRSGLGLPAMLT